MKTNCEQCFDKYMGRHLLLIIVGVGIAVFGLVNLLMSISNLWRFILGVSSIIGGCFIANEGAH